jgi:hypothetical protein
MIKAMNIEYLTKEILPVREQEIKDGKNAGTRQPIYVVLDLVTHYCEGHTDYLGHTTNEKGKNKEFGYIDLALDTEGREFVRVGEPIEGMLKPEKVTKFYTDRVVAFFLTSKAAHEYLQYQKHNLPYGYVYVFYSGYRNAQMDMLLNEH